MVNFKLSSASNWFLNLSRPLKRSITLAVDFLAAVFSLWLAFSLRYSEFYLPPENQLWIFLLAPMIATPVFIRLGLYRAIVRYMGMKVLWTVVKATLLYSLIFSVIVLLENGDHVVPRTVYGINAIIFMLFAGGSRYIARWWFLNLVNDGSKSQLRRQYIPPVIIYGAGSSGAQIIAALKTSNQLMPVAIIDDDITLQGHQLNGLTVYPFSDLSLLIQKHKVNNILLAMPSISRSERYRLITMLEPYPIHVQTIPNLIDIAEGRVTVSDIQEVDIADLLGREQVEPIADLLHSNITNKVVMVTGAGGSIGSELCRQIVKLSPSMIVLYEQSEFALYSIEKELASNIKAGISVVAILGNVQDQARLEAICSRFTVNTIYHSAAYKHVPIVEKNTIEGVRNNIFGTLHCAKAAINTGVETFVLISTDKAVRPTNTMGATKRFAELVLQALSGDERFNSTRFTMVRFGNVLGSSGSVVPLFREQIAKGGPITVTEPRIIRYFMSIPEAAELVIQAGAMGHGGDVFVLDMGEPVKILDLAKRMIHLSGFIEKDTTNPDGDIEITYTGLRPGEKLYEELLIGDNVSDTLHPKILRAQEKVIEWTELELILTLISQTVESNDTEQLRNILTSHVEEFLPQCAVEDWLVN